MSAMANWIVVVARNNLDLLRTAVKSFLAQDIIGGARVLIVDNDSIENVGGWVSAMCDSKRVWYTAYIPQRGVAHAWNAALKMVFGRLNAEHVLVCNSDVVLRPDTYHWLVADGGLFVTGVGSDDATCVDPHIVIDDLNGVHRADGLMLAGSYACDDDEDHFNVAWSASSKYAPPRPEARRPHPDFSCFLIRREAWERVGPFDEHFAGAFCEDLDYHVRLHNAGIEAYAIDLPFYHVGGGSQTIKRASAEERAHIQTQAAKNREYFKQKWGVEVPTPENGGRDYYALFEKSGNDAEAEAEDDATPPRS